MPPNPKICFISGPLEANTTYFTTHYAPRLLDAISQNHHFVLGPSRGIDALALGFLAERCDVGRITLYLHRREAHSMGRRYAWLDGLGRVVVAGRDHTSRDEAMTRASHYDILRYRTAEECRALYGEKYRERVSGTEKNELRRKTGIGLVWREAEVAAGALEAAEHLELAKGGCGLERKVEEATALVGGTEGGEVPGRN